jgi:hypothetical protein
VKVDDVLYKMTSMVVDIDNYNHYWALFIFYENFRGKHNLRTNSIILNFFRVSKF